MLYLRVLADWALEESDSLDVRNIAHKILDDKLTTEETILLMIALAEKQSRKQPLTMEDIKDIFRC